MSDLGRYRVSITRGRSKTTIAGRWFAWWMIDGHPAYTIAHGDTWDAVARQVFTNEDKWRQHAMTAAGGALPERMRRGEFTHLHGSLPTARTIKRAGDDA